MLTPPWAKSGSSGGSGGSGKTAGGTSGGRRGGAEAEDRRQSVARRLDSGPSFGDQRQQQQQHEAAGLQHAASFDFGLIGSPPKKTRVSRLGGWAGCRGWSPGGMGSRAG